MEKYILQNDIKVFCITATSFPDGVMKAYSTLHSLLPSTEGRKFFGISRPNEKGVIVYKAAVEESYPGEAEKYNCETFTIRKGVYISETLSGWKNNESIFGRTFQELLSDPRIDKNGYCVEMYLGEDEVRCMVGLDPKLA